MAPSVLPDDKEPNHTIGKETRVEHASDTSVADLLQYGNPSLQVTADHRIKMEEAPIQEPGPGEVLIHINTTGICG